MNTLTLPVMLAILLLSSSMSMAAMAETSEGMQLYMPDGQLDSHPMRIYINHDISDADETETSLDRQSGTH